MRIAANGEERRMITDKFLSRRGWRIVAHSMLAGCGVAFLYIVGRMAVDSNRLAYGPSPWILGIEIILSLWLVVLGAMLAKSELANKE
jgi:hypothetical protein